MFGLFKKQPDQQPDDSAREFVRDCNVYCRPESDKVIVASVYNHGGLIVEKPGGAWMGESSNAAALNAAIRASLDCCEYKDDFNYSEQKKSDWPAYQVSGCKTMKRFEADFIRLGVRGVNEKNDFYVVKSPEFGDFDLKLTILVNAYTGNHGEAVQYLVKQYLLFKAAVEADLT